MPLERTPATKAPWPPTAQSAGREIAAYPLTGNPKESFYTIADDLARKGRAIKPIDLVKLNFGTTNLEEVNWYLKNYVGCTEATADGKNYRFGKLKFSDAEPNRAVIFVPRAKVTLDEIDMRKPDPKSALQNGWEFEIASPPRPFANKFIRGNILLAGKGKVALLSSSTEGGFGFSKEEVSAAIAQQLSDDVTLEIGAKVKYEDLAKPGKNILQSLKDTFAVALSIAGFASDDKTVSIAFKPELKFSTTPFAFKAVGTWQRTTDLAPYLPKRANVKSFPVVFSVSPEIGIEFGPQPQYAARLIPAAIIAAAIIGTIGLAALTAKLVESSVSEHALRVNIDCYSRAYEAIIFEGTLPGAGAGPDANLRSKLITAGMLDAEKDARYIVSGIQGWKGTREDAIWEYRRALVINASGSEHNAKANLRRAIEKKALATIAKAKAA